MSFFSLSPQFKKWKWFIYVIYVLAVMDILLTVLTTSLGCIEINPLASTLLGNPILFAGFKLAGVTILIAFPYYFSEQFHPANLSWLVLLGINLFPVANNFVMLIITLFFI